MNYIEIKGSIFKSKHNIPWLDVESYLRRYDGMEIKNIEYADNIKLNAKFASEYAHSDYTKKLRGGLVKTKANLVQVIPELIANATSRRWVENKNKKHDENAIKGWYRYDVHFTVQVYDSSINDYRWNYYTATAVTRINDTGIYLYNIINMKKEARTPTDC